MVPFGRVLRHPSGESYGTLREDPMVPLWWVLCPSGGVLRYPFGGSYGTPRTLELVLWYPLRRSFGTP